MIDDPKTSDYLENPAFKSGRGGLCSTATDYMRFLLMIENGGRFEEEIFIKRGEADDHQSDTQGWRMGDLW